jgi:glycogen(starch) synthase
VLIRSLAHLAPLREIHLVIAGTGPEEQELRKLAAKAPVPVHFLGHRDDIRLLLEAADVVALASRRESFGRLTLEAMAAGRPMVATRAGGLAEAIVDGETGLLVPADDEHALAAAISAMLSDTAIARRYGAAARARFLARYTMAHMAAARIRAWERSLGAAGVR